MTPSDVLVIDEQPGVIERHVLRQKDIRAALAALSDRERKLWDYSFALAAVPVLMLLDRALPELAKDGNADRPCREVLDDAANALAREHGWLRRLNACRSECRLAPLVVAPAVEKPREPELFGSDAPEPVVSRYVLGAALEPLGLIASRRRDHREDPFLSRRAPDVLRGLPAEDAAKVGAVAKVCEAIVALATAPGAARWLPHDRALTVGLVSRSWREAFACAGAVVVLSATPDLDALRVVAGGRDVVVKEIAVADGAPIERVIVATGRGTRSALLRHGRPHWPSVGPLVADALGRCDTAGAKCVLVVVYKTVAQELAGEKAVPHERAASQLARFSAGGRAVHVGHYGALEGLDRWGGVDAVVTIGDPIPKVDVAMADGEVLGLDEAGAAARVKRLTEDALAQAHGRIGAPRRSRPGLALHYGRHVPTGWNASNTTIDTRSGGRPRVGVDSVPLVERLALVKKVGSRAALARLSGVSEHKLGKWLAGYRDLSPGDLQRVREATSGFGTTL